MKRIYLFIFLIFLGMGLHAAPKPDSKILRILKTGTSEFSTRTAKMVNKVLDNNALRVLCSSSRYALSQCDVSKRVPMTLVVPTAKDVSRLQEMEDARRPFRLSLSKQIALAKLTEVPTQVIQNVSPSLIRIYRKGDQDQLANGFIVHYEGTNWILVSFHVAKGEGSKHIIKMRLKDNTEVSFVGTVEKAGAGGLHEADMSLIRIPDKWQDQVNALEVFPVQPEEPLYTIGYINAASQHDDFLPIKRMLIQQDGTTLHMTNLVPGANPLKLLEINGYCGSAVIQEREGKIGVVGIFSGQTEPPDIPNQLSVSFAVELSSVLPIIIHDNSTLRDVFFQGKYITQVPYSSRLKTMSLVRNGYIIATRPLFYFPYPFTYEHTENAFVGIEIKSGDIITFEFRRGETPFCFHHIVP